MKGRTFGESLKVQGLSSLANWTAEEGKPGITGLVIDRKTTTPREGFFRLYGKAVEEFEWLEEQVRLSKQYDWLPFLPDSALLKSPEASDIGEPAARIELTIYRVLRDAAPSRRIKLLHRHKCQICGHTIVLPDGCRHAEAQHVRPLGNPHAGLDVGENILCLCPNHHAELDYGTRPIVLHDLRRVEGHLVGEEYIRYHNEKIYKRSPLR